MHSNTLNLRRKSEAEDWKFMVILGADNQPVLFETLLRGGGRGRKDLKPVLK